MLLCSVSKNIFRTESSELWEIGSVCAPLGHGGKSTVKPFPKTGRLLQVPPQDDPVIHQSQQAEWYIWCDFPMPGIQALSLETQPGEEKPSQSEGTEAQGRR